MVVDDLTALLELIQFFEYQDRYDYIVFIEIIDAGTVVQDNVVSRMKIFLIFGMLLLR
jgi:hypothetical protein